MNDFFPHSNLTSSVILRMKHQSSAPKICFEQQSPISEENNVIFSFIPKHSFKMFFSEKLILFDCAVYSV